MNLWAAKLKSLECGQVEEAVSSGPTETIALMMTIDRLPYTLKRERKSGHVVIWSTNYLSHWICNISKPVLLSAPSQGRKMLKVNTTLRLCVRLNHKPGSTRMINLIYNTHLRYIQLARRNQGRERKWYRKNIVFHCMHRTLCLLGSMPSLWQVKTSCPIKNCKEKQKSPKKQRIVTVALVECWH